jgi:hypothetical protein
MSDPREHEQTGPLLVETNAPAIPDGRPMDAKKQPKKKDRGPIPARQGNGYYADHSTGDRLRSVTTILSGGVPKPGLVHWAGNMCTDSAIENLPALVAASRFPDQLAELRSFITRAHTRKKEERAEVGSLVHTVIESRILGTPLPSSLKVGEDEWALDGPELAPFLEQLLRFETEWKPNYTASEMVVANPEDGYAGTLDYTIGDGLIADALRGMGYDVPAGMDIMGDTKTGGEWDRVTSAGHVHGVYPEAGLQMSAYRRAKVCWLKSGERAPMPATAQVGVVLHLRPEDYRLYPARCGDLEYSYFRHAQMVDEWSSRISSAKADDPVIGKALEVPVAEPAVA